MRHGFIANGSSSSRDGFVANPFSVRSADGDAGWRGSPPLVTPGLSAAFIKGTSAWARVAHPFHHCLCNCSLGASRALSSLCVKWGADRRSLCDSNLESSYWHRSWNHLWNSEGFSLVRSVVLCWRCPADFGLKPDVHNRGGQLPFFFLSAPREGGRARSTYDHSHIAHFLIRCMARMPV